MPTITERFSNLFPGPRARRGIEEQKATLTSLLQKEPWRIREIDSQWMDRYVRHANDVLLTGGSSAVLTEEDRLSTVQQSRLMAMIDPLAKHMIGLWISFGWGQTPQITLKDEAAQKVWSEFYDDPANQAIFKPRKLHKLSKKLLTDGEFCFVNFTNTATGRVRTRVVPTDQITEIISDPDDEDTPLYYKRVWTPVNATGGQTRTLYYPAWTAEEKDLNLVDLPQGAEVAKQPGTYVTMMHIAHEEENGRGWPLLSAGLSWIKAYKNFLQDRAAVSKAVATFVDEITTKGGSRAIEAVRQSLASSLTSISSAYETNPSPTAGSTDIHNEAITRNRLSQSTGAGDASQDGAMIIAQAGLSAGVFPHWLGRGESFRLATAAAMELPTKANFRRYSAFWQDVFADMVHLVLDMAERYGGASFDEEQREVNITTSNLADVDLPAMAGAIAQLQPLVKLPPKVWTILTLQAFNVPDADTIVQEMYPEGGEEVPGLPEPEQPSTPSDTEPAADSGAPETPDDAPETTVQPAREMEEVIAQLEAMLQEAVHESNA